MASNRPTTPIWQWSASEQADAITAGDISASEAVQAAIDQVRHSNSDINAIVDDLSDAALATAKNHDAHLRQHGPLGPLHGVPITIKENVDQKGRATPNGVAAYKDVIAPDDAPVVRNLRKAGAIVIGRTNTPEFSFRATTDNPLHGPTHNPWNRALSPGGSSGGASAAVMSGYGALAHGNDIGGSLRFPAYACGATTIKPGFGRVPAYNPSQTAERGLLAQMMSVQGVIAREVKDLRLSAPALMAPDPHDPWQAPVPYQGPAHDRPLKVAVTKNGLNYPIHSAITEAVGKAADILASAGYAVEEVEPPMVLDIAKAWQHNTMGEVKIIMDPAIRSHGSATINQIFDHYYDMFGIPEPKDLVVAMAERTRFLRAWSLFLADYPLVLTPFLMRPHYGLNEDAESRESLEDIFNASIYSYTMNYLGLPAAIISTHLHNDQPVAVQIVARRWREDLAVDAAEIVESEVGIMAKELWHR